MKEPASISDSLYEEEFLLAERELSSFLAAVAELYGQGQAGLSAEDWLHESALMDDPPRSEARKWRRGHDRRRDSIGKSCPCKN